MSGVYFDESKYEPPYETYEVFERRWHGWARWQRQRHWMALDNPRVGIGQRIEGGWIRPPPSWGYKRFRLDVPEQLK